MSEIRICWNVNDKVSQLDEPCHGGNWHPDSPENREMLRILVEFDNEVHGLGTRWIEERKVCALRTCLRSPEYQRQKGQMHEL